LQGRSNSTCVLQERLKGFEWFAALLAFLGILGLGLSSEPDHLDHAHVSATWVFTCFLGTVLALGTMHFFSAGEPLQSYSADAQSSVVHALPRCGMHLETECLLVPVVAHAPGIW
jgi:drug/metabolite transporter (DMT)-like permease